MNRALLHAAALVLPLIGLGGMWISADRLSRQGSEWDVPIQGYDPRDLLQGHYVQFQYDWPWNRASTFDRDYAYANICLRGPAPNIASAKIWQSSDGCDGFVRSGEGYDGRLYVSQAEAQRLQVQLWNPKLQGVVRKRLRPDGHITPLRITFRPRPPEPQARP